MCGSISPREREMMRLEYEQMLARQAEEADREIEALQRSLAAEVVVDADDAHVVLVVGDRVDATVRLTVQAHRFYGRTRDRGDCDDLRTVTRDADPLHDRSLQRTLRAELHGVRRTWANTRSSAVPCVCTTGPRRWAGHEFTCPLHQG